MVTKSESLEIKSITKEILIALLNNNQIGYSDREDSSLANETAEAFEILYNKISRLQ